MYVQRAEYRSHVRFAHTRAITKKKKGERDRGEEGGGDASPRSLHRNEPFIFGAYEVPTLSFFVIGTLRSKSDRLSRVPILSELHNALRFRSDDVSPRLSTRDNHHKEEEKRARLT